MTGEITINEIVPIDLEGGVLVNGFPSTGITWPEILSLSFEIRNEQILPMSSS